MPNTPSFPPIGQPFIVLPTVDSTNNYAMAQARLGLATHGSVYFAMEQTMGKGQRGKKWLTAPGENIMLSAVVQPMGILLHNQFLLSASMALASYDFLKKYTGAENTRIKWPNDLYWQDRKAGGILIESVVGNQEQGDDSRKMQTINDLTRSNLPWYWSIIGIGININQTDFTTAIRNPVSIKQITGKTEDVLKLSQELCNCMNTRFIALYKSTPAAIIEEYIAVLYKLNQPVKLKKENAVFETTILGISPEGKLLTRDVLEREFMLGEVEWIG